MPYKLFFILLILPVVTSCSINEPVDVVVPADIFILDAEKKTFRCDPPLVRIRKNAALHIKIKENWSAKSPWQHIYLDNDLAVSVDAILVAESGKQYNQNIIGSASGKSGKFIEFRFSPQIPKNEKIKLIVLQASNSITVEKIIWHNFDPI